MNQKEKKELIQTISNADFEGDTKSVWSAFVKALPVDYDELQITNSGRQLDPTKLAKIYETRLRIINIMDDNTWAHFGFEESASNLRQYSEKICLIGIKFRDTRGFCFISVNRNKVIAFVYVTPIAPTSS